MSKYKNIMDVNITNPITIKDLYGQPVSFIGVDHYDASALFSDTVNLPAIGRLYLPTAGSIALILSNSTVALTYTLEAGFHPISVKRILSTGTTVTSAYIII